MKIACVQMDIAFGQPDMNFAEAERLIAEAAAEGAKIIVLPEMWNTGYALGELEAVADNEGERTKHFLASLAEKYGVHIIGGSVAVKKGDSFFNTMYAANKNGEIIAEYDKLHLFKLMDEHHYMSPGNKMNLFELDGVKCAGVICYDIRFPEWIRLHALEGAKILFVPAEWPAARVDHWELLLQARAIENQCFVVAVNRVGSDPGNDFNGHSMIIAPWGEKMLAGKEEAGIFYAEIDIRDVDKVRERIPVYADRRPEIYNNAKPGTKED